MPQETAVCSIILCTYLACRRRQRAETLACSLVPLYEGSHDQVSVDTNEGYGDEGEGWQRAFEQQARGHGEERANADAEQGRDVAEVQEATRCREKGQEDKVAQAEAETQCRAERREDEQQAIEYRGVLPHERSGRSYENAEQVGGYRGEDDDQDRAHGGYVAGERDAQARGREYPRKVGNAEREQDQGP